MSPVKQSLMQPLRSHGTLVVLTRQPLSCEPKSFSKNRTANGSNSFKTRFSAKFPGGDGHNYQQGFQKKAACFFKSESKSLVVQHGERQQLRNRAVCHLTKKCSLQISLLHLFPFDILLGQNCSHERINNKTYDSRIKRKINHYNYKNN